jgi:hypothetical protein
MKAILNNIGASNACRVHPVAGQPPIGHYELPDDLKEFYSYCGGVDLFVDDPYALSIVTPCNFVRANPIIASVESEGDISFDWFIIAQGGEQYVTIDLNRNRLGRCYDSFWDRHAVRGTSSIVALSFSEFLQRSFEAGGGGWYWLSNSFQSHGDAYDLIK